jgi:hypothetical protein
MDAAFVPLSCQPFEGDVAVGSIKFGILLFPNSNRKCPKGINELLASTVLLYRICLVVLSKSRCELVAAMPLQCKHVGIDLIQLLIV